MHFLFDKGVLNFRYPTQGLQARMLGDDLHAGLEMKHDASQDAEESIAMSHEESEESPRAVGQHIAGCRRAGPVYAAAIKHCSLQPEQRIGQVESYR